MATDFKRALMRQTGHRVFPPRCTIKRLTGDVLYLSVPLHSTRLEHSTHQGLRLWENHGEVSRWSQHPHNSWICQSLLVSCRHVHQSTGCLCHQFSLLECSQWNRALQYLTLPLGWKNRRSDMYTFPWSFMAIVHGCSSTTCIRNIDIGASAWFETGSMFPWFTF